MLNKDTLIADRWRIEEDLQKLEVHESVTLQEFIDAYSGYCKFSEIKNRLVKKRVSYYKEYFVEYYITFEYLDAVLNEKADEFIDKEIPVFDGRVLFLECSLVLDLLFVLEKVEEC